MLIRFSSIFVSNSKCRKWHVGNKVVSRELKKYHTTHTHYRIDPKTDLNHCLNLSLYHINKKLPVKILLIALCCAFTVHRKWTFAFHFVTCYCEHMVRMAHYLVISLDPAQLWLLYWNCILSTLPFSYILCWCVHVAGCYLFTVTATCCNKFLCL